MANRLSKPEDIVWRRIGDDIVVIKDDGLSVNVLNKTAAFIWEMCIDRCEVHEIAAKLSERFAVSFEEASADVQATIAELEKTGLLKQAQEAGGQ